MRKIAVLDARLIPPAIVEVCGIPKGFHGYHDLLIVEEKRRTFIDKVNNNINNWRSRGSPQRSAAEWQQILEKFGGFRDVFLEYMSHLEALQDKSTVVSKFVLERIIHIF
jgi:outer membrane PBP1 activator LpoA protein